MGFRSDQYATMLLTMALSPNREEYARPYSTQEFYQLEDRIRESCYHDVGDLLGVDISGLMLRLDITEEEGYRIYTLLNRGVQLGYSIDTFLSHGIEVATIYDINYPKRLLDKMPHAAPPYLYLAGNQILIGRPAVAIMGINGIKTTPEVRDGILSLVKGAVKSDFVIITGGELGVSRIAAGAVLQEGGTLIDIVGGGLYEHLEYDNIAKLIEQNRAAVISLEHPEAMFTVSHAIARNKVIFALANAAFICNTDNKRGETDALRSGICDWIYAYSGYPANRTLIAKGAAPVADLRSFDVEAMQNHWRNSQSEQINLFDLLDP